MLLFLKKNRKAFVLAGLIFFHLVLISVQVPLGQEQTYLEKVIFAVISPVQHGILYLSRKAVDAWNGYFYLREIQSQNRELREELFSLRQENNFLKQSLLKYRGESEIREYLANIHKSILVASVIGLDASNIYKSVVINTGALNGVRKDMVVLDKLGHLVGRVIGPVSMKEARVQLVTDDQSGVSAQTSDSRVLGVLSGNGKGHCYLKYVLATAAGISEGEEVITTGFDGIFPPGIRVGKIVSVAEEDSLFQKITVEPFFSFKDMDRLAVLTQDVKELLRD